MNRELTCILCPRGCHLTITGQPENLQVSGNGCKNGIRYGISECLNPVRTVTSVLRVGNRCDTMVSVKSTAPIKKADMLDFAAALRNMVVCAPVKIGDVIATNLFGADVVATKNIN